MAPTPNCAIAAFILAAEIKPDDLQIQTELGRAYESWAQLRRPSSIPAGDADDRIQADEPLAAVVDHRIAVALEQQVIRGPALERYYRVLDLLEYPSTAKGTTPAARIPVYAAGTSFDAIGKSTKSLATTTTRSKAYREVAEIWTPKTTSDLQAACVETLANFAATRGALTRPPTWVRSSTPAAESIATLEDDR